MATPRRDVPRTLGAGRVIAHRGASRVAPENTLAAFRRAAEQGATWVEFDVSLLGDGTPVVHHDGELGRCTDGAGPLSRLAAPDLAGIDAGGWFSPEFAGEPLPILTEVLDLLDALEMSANLELKVHGPEAAALAETVAALLSERAWTRRRILVSSFTLPALHHLRAAAPEQPLAVLWEAPPANWAATVDALAAASVHLDWRRLRPAFVEQASAAGVEVRVYTINDPDRVAGFRDLGLTGVITDHPPLFLDRPDWAAWAEGDRRDGA